MAIAIAHKISFSSTCGWLSRFPSWSPSHHPKSPSKTSRPSPSTPTSAARFKTARMPSSRSRRTVATPSRDELYKNRSSRKTGKRKGLWKSYSLQYSLWKSIFREDIFYTIASRISTTSRCASQSRSSRRRSKWSRNLSVKMVLGPRQALVPTRALTSLDR